MQFKQNFSDIRQSHTKAEASQERPTMLATTWGVSPTSSCVAGFFGGFSVFCELPIILKSLDRGCEKQEKRTCEDTYTTTNKNTKRR